VCQKPWHHKCETRLLHLGVWNINPPWLSDSISLMIIILRLLIILRRWMLERWLLMLLMLMY
jgi:hypothetical protein